jgi:hypothetical protein
MKNSNLIRGLAALAVCALVLPVVGSLKNPVTRPLKMSGIVTEVYWDSDYSGDMVVVGTATHLGKFESYAYWEPNSDGSLYVWATFTAANGDTLDAEFPAFVGLSGEATITGGTGRFAHASGSYVATFSGATTEVFTVEGTITY